ncbi:MAG: hypothetical protein Fur0025_07690 [Oscillatoriaceae cyanobacterium]
MFPQLQLHRRKPSSPARKPKGFTLIELLVGIMISSVIIMPLLGLVDSLLRQDRQEQVKTRSEQEIAAALDYIARDMQESVYIYDQAGVNAIADQLPTTPDRTPVLVFWKRRFLSRDSFIDHDKNSATPTKQVGCLEKFSDEVTDKNPNPTGSIDCGSYRGKNQDYSVFSLVVYYLIDNGQNTANTNWAPNAMRIARWELSGGVSTDPASKNNPYTPLPRNSDSVSYLALPDKGFQLFDLKNTTGTLAQKMDTWQRHSEGYDLQQNQIVTLVDYIDASPVSTSASLTPSCPATSSPNPTNQVVPASATTATGSFYACVPQASRSTNNNTLSRPIAQVFIRGNSLLRMEPDATYSDRKKVYFPTTNIRVQGIGLIGSN